jgi:hypothetical protein
MSEHETGEDRRLLPKPLALTLDLVQQVAAGTVTILPEPTKLGATLGIWPPPGPIVVVALPQA